MSPRDRGIFESIAGDLLEELGYEVESRGRPIRFLERAYWKVDHICKYRAALASPLRGFESLVGFASFHLTNLRGRGKR